jgi:hypothetical protein
MGDLLHYGVASTATLTFLQSCHKDVHIRDNFVHAISVHGIRRPRVAACREILILHQLVGWVCGAYSTSGGGDGRNGARGIDTGPLGTIP